VTAPVGPAFTIKLPLARLNDILSTLGIDAHQFHDHFSRVSVRTPYPIVYGGEEDVRLRMAVRPNAFASPRTGRADEIYRRHAARILVPDRIWWDTAHVVALYSEEPVISNIFYAVNIKVDDSIRTLAEKALVLWLNTTWGILIVLFNRQETRGRWTRLKMAQWRLLPVLDVTRLKPNTLERLASVFDKYCEKTPARIPQQFNPKNPDPVRLGIDMDFLKALDTGLDEARVKEALLDLYRHVHVAFTIWIGN